MTMGLTDDEAALVDFYRVMAPADRAAIKQIARSMAERAEQIALARPTGFRPLGGRSQDEGPGGDRT